MDLVDGHDLRFKRLDAPRLSQTRVQQIVQDDKGFIWFGTQNGLNRYDGYELKEFRHQPDSDDSLSGVYVYSLLRDRTKGLWVGSDEFLDRFDPNTETFKRYNVTATGVIPSAVNFADMSQDAAGLIWLCTRNGLYKLDPIAHQTELFHRWLKVRQALFGSAPQAAGVNPREDFID